MRGIAERAGRWIADALNLAEWVTATLWVECKKTEQRVDRMEERLEAVEHWLSCPSFPPEEKAR